MKRLLLGLVLVFPMSSPFAACMVDDGTFYAKDKQWMTAFAIYMDKGEQANALQMVDDGRIKSVTRASAVVLERDGPLVHTHIGGIGKVWIYETFLRCQ